jgi:hypothetical protein
MVAAADGTPAPTLALSASPPPVRRRDRAYLTRTAEQIRGRLRVAARDIMAAGQLLLAAHRRIGRGTFLDWLRSDSGPGVTVPTAYRLMSVAKAFGGMAAAEVRQIPPGALYVLSQPAVPQSLREYVVEKVRDGKPITQTEALHLVENHRKPIETPRGYRAAPGVARPKEDAEATHAADNWLALLAILQPGTTFHVTHTADEENGERTVSVTVLDGGRPRTVAHGTLEGAVVELAGLKRKRVCRTCKGLKRLDEFSRLKDGPGGRNRACLQCERDRVAEATRARVYHGEKLQGDDRF